MAGAVGSDLQSPCQGDEMDVDGAQAVQVTACSCEARHCAQALLDTIRGCVTAIYGCCTMQLRKALLLILIALRSVKTQNDGSKRDLVTLIACSKEMS